MKIVADALSRISEIVNVITKSRIQNHGNINTSVPLSLTARSEQITNVVVEREREKERERERKREREIDR